MTNPSAYARTQAAVVAERNGRFTIRDVELSPPRADEVVVGMEASGMCHADLSAQSGSLPFPLPDVLGHEGVGRVAAVGAAVTGVAAGDRVVISFSCCGHCAACLRAAPAYCRDWPRLNLVGGGRGDGSSTLRCDGMALHGHFFGQSSFSRHIVTTARAVVKVPDDIPASVLAPLGCGVQTGVGAVTNVLRPAPGARVAVFGAGAVGLSALMGLGLTGAAQIIAIDIHPARLALARQLGATDTIDAAGGDTADRIRELTGGVGLDGAIETSGSLGALRTAIAGLAPASTCVVIGVPNFGETVAVAGWRILSRHPVPESLFTDRQRELLSRLRVKVAHISRGAGAQYADIDGEYDLWYRRTGRKAFLVRPDHYIFGSVQTMEQLPALLDELETVVVRHGGLARVPAETRNEDVLEAADGA